MFSLLPAAAPHLVAGSTIAHAGPWGGGFGWLFLLIPLFWIGLIVLLFLTVGRRFRRAGGPAGWGQGPWGAHPGWVAGGGGRSAELTLAERFAQGDIDEQEYRARLEVLRASRDAPPTR